MFAVDLSLHGGVLQAGRHGAGAGAGVFAAVRSTQHHGAAVADRWVAGRSDK